MDDCPSKEELSRKITVLEEEIRRLKSASGADAEKHRQVLQSIEEGYYELDLKGNIVSFNLAAGSLLGYAPHEIAGMNFRNCTSAVTARRMIDVFHGIYETGHPGRMVNYDVICKDGSIRSHEISAGLMRDDTGKPTGFHVIVHDITARKHSETLLKKSEERYRAIFENTGNATVLIAKDTTILLANSKFENLTGYTKTEMEGKLSWTVFIDPQDLDRMKRYHYERRKDDSSAPHFYEFRLLNRKGETREIFLTVALIPNSNESVASCMDVTDRKRAEEALRRSEERYRTILDTMDEAYFECDLRGSYTYVNEAHGKILGYAREELLGMNHQDCTSAETAKRAYEIFNAIYRTGHQRTIADYEVIRKDGKQIIVELSASLLRGDSGEAIGFRGLGRDVTQRIAADRALKESERKYRLLAENLRDVIWILDADLKFVYVSPSVFQLRGYTPEEVMQQPLDQVLAPESYRKATELFSLERMMAPSKSRQGKDWKMNLDLELLRKDGSTVWTEVTLSIFYDDNGRPEGLLGITHDISDRKKADAALRESEERYRTIFEHTATANIIVSEDTTILLANSNFEQITGYTREDVENKMSWTDFVMEEDLEKMKQRHMQRRTDPGKVISSYEFKGKTRSGEVRDFYMSVSIIPETCESVASLIDTTDRNKAIEALGQSEERFRDLARLLPETVFETNAKGQFSFVNEISLERFGYTSQEVEKGIHILDVMAPEDHEQILKDYMRIMRGERPGLSEYIARKKDGTRFPALVHTTPIYRNGGYTGQRGFLIDITEKKNLEEQLMRSEKLKAIGTLAGGIAHDFNNLLMGLLGNITLMLMNLDESHPFHIRLKNMETYVQHGSDLTRQLLGFARGGKYEVKSTDLGVFVHRSAQLFGRTKKEIRMHCKVDDDLWAVEVDRGQMEQVMLNLFVNAWQAMPGGGDIYLSVENVVLCQQEASPFNINPGRFVKITVTDTGVGMDEATIAHIFEPFFSTKQRGRGTGLGLASVYGIIKNHGGFILVRSEKAVGTSFMVHLPASTKCVEQVRKTADPIHKGSETVLLIDDEQMILDIGTHMLESLGYKVLTASGGSKGIEIFDRNMADIDLVLLDMIMPGIGGRDTFTALRRRNTNLKVLLLSGYSLDGQAGEILAQGCSGFIQKPFTMAELSKKLRQVLEAP